MKTIVLTLSILAFVYAVPAQTVPAGFDLSNYGVRVEPDKRLMVVLATLESGVYTDASGQQVKLIQTKLSESGNAFRERLQRDNAAVPDDLKQKIGLFLSQYKKRYSNRTDAEIVAPFMSMAYTLSPAPELADPLLTNDLPGSLLDVLDFAPLVREYYKRSGISARLDEYVKEYQRASDTKVKGSAREMVSDLLDYLHTKPETYYTERVRTETQKSNSKATLQKTELRDRERRFFIVPELLSPAGVVTFLNVRDDYFVIVPPDTDLTRSDARRAFLRFVTDALVLRNSKDLTLAASNIRQLLDARRKINPELSPDIYLAVSRSLAAAADARQAEYTKVKIATDQARRTIDQKKTVEEKKAVSAELERLKRSFADETALTLSEEYEKGAVLAFYFADQLRGLEDSGFDISSSMREMILSFEPSKETSRLEAAAAARSRALAAREDKRKSPVATTIVAENPVTNKLLDIQKLIDAKNYSAAETGLKMLANDNASDARVQYNLGRVASLSAQEITDPEQQNLKLIESKKAYEKVIELVEKQPRGAVGIDPTLVSLTYVALAKIYEFYDNSEYAVKLYDRAIAIGTAGGNAYNQAIAEKQRLLAKP